MEDITQLREEEIEQGYDVLEEDQYGALVLFVTTFSLWWLGTFLEGVEACLQYTHITRSSHNGKVDSRHTKNGFIRNTLLSS